MKMFSYFCCFLSSKAHSKRLICEPGADSDLHGVSPSSKSKNPFSALADGWIVEIVSRPGGEDGSSDGGQSPYVEVRFRSFLHRRGERFLYLACAPDGQPEVKFDTASSSNGENADLLLQTGERPAFFPTRWRLEPSPHGDGLGFFIVSKATNTGLACDEDGAIYGRGPSIETNRGRSWEQTWSLDPISKEDGHTNECLAHIRLITERSPTFRHQRMLELEEEKRRIRYELESRVAHLEAENADLENRNHDYEDKIGM